MNWKKVKLGESIQITKGKKHQETVKKIGSSKRYIQIEDLSSFDNLKFTDEKGIEVLQNDLVLAWDGANAGKVGTNLKGVIGSTLARLRIINNEIDSKFLFRFLESKFELIKSQRTGATIPHVNGASLRNIEIPLPDLATQKHIAEVLDKADVIRQQNRALLAQYDELLQSTFIELFGDPVKNPKGWEVRKLEEVLDFLTSGSRGWAEYYSNSGSIFLRIQNVGYNKLKMEEVTFVNPPNTAESKRTRVQKNDIILSITADLGRTAVIPDNFGEAYINQHLALLRPKEEINSIFISALLASDFGQRQFKSANKGGVKAGLNFNDIKSINVLLPPISLQQHFAKIVRLIEVQKEQVKTALVESEALFEGLLAKYFN